MLPQSFKPLHKNELECFKRVPTAGSHHRAIRSVHPWMAWVKIKNNVLQHSAVLWGNAFSLLIVTRYPHLIKCGILKQRLLIYALVLS